MDNTNFKNFTFFGKFANSTGFQKCPPKFYFKTQYFNFDCHKSLQNHSHRSRPTQQRQVRTQASVSESESATGHCPPFNSIFNIVHSLNVDHENGLVLNFSQILLNFKTPWNPWISLNFNRPHAEFSIHARRRELFKCARVPITDSALIMRLKGEAHCYEEVILGQQLRPKGIFLLLLTLYLTFSHHGLRSSGWRANCMGDSEMGEQNNRQS